MSSIPKNCINEYNYLSKITGIEAEYLALGAKSSLISPEDVIKVIQQLKSCESCVYNQNYRSAEPCLNCVNYNKWEGGKYAVS